MPEFQVVSDEEASESDMFASENDRFLSVVEQSNEEQQELEARQMRRCIRVANA